MLGGLAERCCSGRCVCQDSSGFRSSGHRAAVLPLGVEKAHWLRLLPHSLHCAAGYSTMHCSNQCASKQQCSPLKTSVCVCASTRCPRYAPARAVGCNTVAPSAHASPELT